MSNRLQKNTNAGLVHIRHVHAPISKGEAVGLEILVAMLGAFLFQAWWRGQNDALRAKKWSSLNGSVFALRFRKDLFIFTFRRDLTAEELMLHARVFEIKYGLIAHAVSKRKWPRYFPPLKSFMRIYHEHFPHYLSFESCSRYMTVSKLCLGYDGFDRPVTVDTHSKIGLVTIGGKSGTGKSSLTSAISRQYPNQDILVLGGKPGSYPGAKWIGAGNSKDKIQELLDALLNIEAEIQSRYRELAIHGVDSVARAPKDVRAKMHRKLLILEEADSFLSLGAYSKECRILGEAIIAKTRFIIKNGRGSSYLTVLLNQTLQKSELGVNLREGGVIISSECDTPEISNSLFGSDIAYSKSLRNGIFVIQDEVGIRRFKSISPEDQNPRTVK